MKYLHYRVHENIFCRTFGMTNHARSDDSADAYKDGLGVGLKTWVGCNNQKIAEFNEMQGFLSSLDDYNLAIEVSKLRNLRIKTTMNLLDLKEIIYHIVKRVPHKMYIYECSYDYVDLNSIELIKDKTKDKQVYFKDGKHTYHYNKSKSTLYMKFDHLIELDRFDVEIEDDPYSLLINLLNSKEVQKIQYFISYPRLCLRLYSEHKGRKIVEPKSGLNQWNASGRKRNPNELYIPYPAIDRKRMDFFPSRDESFDLLLPDGKCLKAKVCQQDSKAIMSNPMNVFTMNNMKINSNICYDKCDFCVNFTVFDI